MFEVIMFEMVSEIRVLVIFLWMLVLRLAEMMVKMRKARLLKIGFKKKEMKNIDLPPASLNFTFQVSNSSLLEASLK
jgi:hypothetical protein